jgi:hypothetical protein
LVQIDCWQALAGLIFMLAGDSLQLSAPSFYDVGWWCAQPLHQRC